MMTNEIRNIEKFFRDLFGNFRVKPYRDSWDKIADALDTTNPKDALIPDIDEVGTLFKGYKVTPSESVWQNIYRILERDKFTARRFSRTAISAIVAFFSNTTVRVIASIVVLGGLSLLFFNPFKNDNPKLAIIDHTRQVKETVLNPKTPSPNQNQFSGQGQSVESSAQNQLTASYHKADNTQRVEDHLNKTANIQKQTAINKSAETAPTTPIKNQILPPPETGIQNPTVLNNITQSNSIKTNQLISDNKTNFLIKDNLLNKYPSIKFGIRQNRFRYDKAIVPSVDLNKKIDEIVAKYSSKMAKKYTSKRDLFYIEAYYLPIYGSTTYIARQMNSPSLERSYNEYLSGNPNSCIGINFGYNPNRFSFETGITYQDRYTRRNDDLKWISYHDTITKDSIGFVFNTIDSTYHTIYKTDTINKKVERLKSYRTMMSYHTIEVPLLIGYKLKYKRNTITVRTGIIASIIIQSSEEVTNIDVEARPYIIYPDKNKVEFSYLLNLSYDFNINDNFKISLTPTFRYNITGLYKGYSINSRPITYGCGLGVKYIF